MTCDRCGHALQVGDYPFCKGQASDHAPAAPMVKPDSIIGGFWAENAWREPRYFESQKAYERALDQSGLMLKPKAPTHGRALDPQTLENARALVSRARSIASDPSVTLETLKMETRILTQTMRVAAER